MRRLLVALVVALASASASAALFTCFPKTLWTPMGSGTDWARGVVEPAAAGGVRISYRGWWCPKPDGTWERYRHMSVDSLEWPAARLEKALDTAMRSANALEAMQDAVLLGEIKPTASQQAAWDRAVPLANVEIDKLKPVFTPAPPPTAVFLVTGLQAFPLKPDGTRSTTPLPIALTRGEPCDCVKARVLQFGATFCAIPRLSTATQTVVAGCTKQP